MMFRLVSSVLNVLKDGIRIKPVKRRVTRFRIVEQVFLFQETVRMIKIAVVQHVSLVNIKMKPTNIPVKHVQVHVNLV